MSAAVPNSPFNFVQVIIAALGAGYLNVIAFFIGGSAGASMQIGDGKVVHFAQVLGFTWAPLVVLGFIVFLIGRAKKGVTKLAQWVGAIVALGLSAFAIVKAEDAATAVTLVIIHVITAAAWVFAVHYGNKQIHQASKELAIA